MSGISDGTGFCMRTLPGAGGGGVSHSSIHRSLFYMSSVALDTADLCSILVKSLGRSSLRRTRTTPSQHRKFMRRSFLVNIWSPYNQTLLGWFLLWPLFHANRKVLGCRWSHHRATRAGALNLTAGPSCHFFEFSFMWFARHHQNLHVRPSPTSSNGAAPTLRVT